MIGAPGCGKTAIGKNVAEQLGFVYIGSGEIARALAKVDDGAHAALMNGMYAPEDDMRHAILYEIANAQDSDTCFVLDGFPRTFPQSIVLEQHLKRPVDYILVVAPTHMCVRRTIERGREYDNADAIAARFEAYDHDTLPMISKLPNYHRITSIGSTQDNANILRDIVKNQVWS